VWLNGFNTTKWTVKIFETGEYMKRKAYKLIIGSLWPAAAPVAVCPAFPP